MSDGWGFDCAKCGRSEEEDEMFTMFIVRIGRRVPLCDDCVSEIIQSWLDDEEE